MFFETRPFRSRGYFFLVFTLLLYDKLSFEKNFEYFTKCCNVHDNDEHIVSKKCPTFRSAKQKVQYFKCFTAQFIFKTENENKNSKISYVYSPSKVKNSKI